jgi:hypothetical protein
VEGERGLARDSGDLHSIVEAARGSIAKAAGVLPGAVKISIDFGA